MLGWYGCQDKHLSKYSSLLEKQGYPSLRGILPGHAVFSPFAFPRRRWAAHLLDAVAAVDPQGRRPVVLYAFSNGEAQVEHLELQERSPLRWRGRLVDRCGVGAAGSSWPAGTRLPRMTHLQPPPTLLTTGGGFVVEQIDQLVRDEPRHRPFASRIAGLVFDSAPCYMSLRVGATAIGYGMPWPLRVLAALLFFLSVRGSVGSIELLQIRALVVGNSVKKALPLRLHAGCHHRSGSEQTHRSLWRSEGRLCVCMLAAASLPAGSPAPPALLAAAAAACRCCSWRHSSRCGPGCTGELLVSVVESTADRFEVNSWHFASSVPAGLLALPAHMASIALTCTVPPPSLQPCRRRNMRQLSLGRRSLYLFSDDDPLCLPDKLEQLIAARRAAGAEVQEVRWERSQHVGHLLKHYKEYTAALFGFLASLAA